MALFAFDGTWNEGKTGDDDQYRNTNVFRFFQAYQRNSGTHDFYLAGVGTRFDLLGRALGGIFGLGELSRLDEAYDHLCKTWADGDHTIDVIGFSRGAATTLDFCHRIQDDGIKQPGTDDVVERQPHIRFLGVWDVVAAFGLANSGTQFSTSGTICGFRARTSTTASMHWRWMNDGCRFFPSDSMVRTRSGSVARIPTSAAATAIAA